MAELISVAEAQHLVLERTRRIDAERVPIERAAGRVLAEPAVALVDLPPFPSSAMDGFALRAEDTTAAPVTLPVVARVAAGSPAGRPLGTGEAMAISTGGVVPDGADAVVPLEVAEESAEGVRITGPVTAGANVRPRGGDVMTGGSVLEANTALGPAQVAALAAAGVSEIRCAKRPRVGILVTGSELRQPGESLGRGEIYESNGLLLAAACSSAGAVPAQLGVVPDNRDELRPVMERALLGFDMLVTTGGASVGPHDLVRSMFPDFRIEEVFWGVRMRPGKPVCFAMRRDHPVFVLPGNPVSVLVTFELFVRPAINALLGVPDPLPVYRRGALGAALARNPHRDEFVRARIRWEAGTAVLDPLAGQESHMIVRSAQAGALVAVDAGEAELPAGAEVRYIHLA